MLQAPEAGLPVLFVEVDNCTESPEMLAAKFEKYRTYFRLKTKTPQGLEVPVWRTRYAATGRDGHPPVAVVFNPGTRTGPEALKNRMNTVLQLSRQVWSGTYQWHGTYGPGEERDGYVRQGRTLFYSPPSKRQERSARAAYASRPRPWPASCPVRPGDGDVQGLPGDRCGTAARTDDVRRRAGRAAALIRPVREWGCRSRRRGRVCGCSGG
ncbi:replication-relaxation family protein [Streptomyces sp. NPDC060006]|uniref:replication-relaxation family protein n=1 Tax=unclassified Streptomyces TaxID=2593676 RepID=UPI0036A0AD06